MEKCNRAPSGLVKKLFAVIAVISALLCSGASSATAGAGDKMYVAIDGPIGVAVVDPNTLDAWGSIKVGNITRKLVLSPDKKLVYVTALGDNMVKAIDVATDTVVKGVKVAPWPYVLALTPDGKRLFVSTETGLYVVDTGSFQEAGSLDLGGMTQAMVISPDGSRVYMAVGDPEAELVTLDVKTMKPVSRVKLPDQVFDMKISPDGKTLYANSVAESKIALIDTAKLKVTDEVKAYGERGFALSRDGNELWIPGPENTITVYSLKENKVVAKPALPSGDGLRMAEFSPDGKLLFALAVGEGSRMIYVFDAASRKKTGEIKLDTIPRDVLYIQK